MYQPCSGVWPLVVIVAHGTAGQRDAENPWRERVRRLTATCAVAALAVYDGRYHTPWTDFQTASSPRQKKFRSRKVRRWKDLLKNLFESCQKTCHLVFESYW
ncbi:unnamed protein product [Hapterophycus canaliculatus]